MAKKQESNVKIVLERNYNVPLRKEYLKAPRYKRTNRAVKALKQFLTRHMKSEDIKIGKHLNQKMWKNGIKNPPHHINITAIKDENGVVRAELVGKEIELEKKAPKAEGMAERLGLKDKNVEDLKQTYKPKAEEKEATKEAPKKEAKVEAKKEAAPAKETKKNDKKETPKKE